MRKGEGGVDSLAWVVRGSWGPLPWTVPFTEALLGKVTLWPPWPCLVVEAGVGGVFSVGGGAAALGGAQQPCQGCGRHSGGPTSWLPPGCLLSLMGVGW